MPLLVITLILSIYWPYFDNMMTNGQTDWHRQSRVLLFLRHVLTISMPLHWTPNAYRNMLMRIFTPSLYFQSVFNDFQCVITLLRALSVALLLLIFHTADGSAWQEAVINTESLGLIDISLQIYKLSPWKKKLCGQKYKHQCIQGIQ